MAKKKSYFDRNNDNNTSQSTTTAATTKTGDLNGDGKVDWVDSLLSIVGFIQTSKGQIFVFIAAAAFSAVINISTYTKSTTLFFEFIHAAWLTPFTWLVAILFWGVIQALEVAPRIEMWDFEAKVQGVKNRQGNGIDLKKYDRDSGQQSDLPFWQEITINDSKIKTGYLVIASIGAHALDVAMLWSDFPLFNTATWQPIALNIAIAAFLIFSFEALVGLAQSLKQLRQGYKI